MIPMNEYAKRRKVLMQKVGSNGIVILPSAVEVPRNGDAFYPFRQNSDFYYLTGFNEPEAVLVLLPDGKEGQYILFNRVRDRSREIWDGPRAGQEGACHDFHADEAYPISELETRLLILLEDREVIHYPLGLSQTFDHVLMGCVNHLRAKVRSGVQSPIAFYDISPTIHEMRLFKSPEEIALMKKAAEISAKGHQRAIEICRPNLYEYQLEAALMQVFFENGARFPAYTPIVGTGKNSCILHYVQNDHKIADGDVVLIDAGCEYQNYASDVTRTFPANGKFTPEQRDIYEIVLAAQLAGIEAVKPGASWIAAQRAIVSVITQGLIDLGILQGSLQQLIEEEAYIDFYMHRSGHWLGLDVHDVGQYRIDKKWRALEAGMCLTVEPGIYISSFNSKVPKRWHDIGVRIEDDIVVTEKGREVLSSLVPKTTAEIEGLMAK